MSTQEKVNVVTSISDLPPEILEMILNHLIDRHKQNSTLSFRLVSQQWKDIIDSITEKECLKIITKWLPEHLGTSYPRLQSVPQLFIRQNPGSFNERWCANFVLNRPQKVYCPTPILKHPGNPFPSKSLCVVVASETDRINENPLVEWQVLLPNFGNYLTSLSLEFLSMKIKGLTTILSHTRKLKALQLSGLFLAQDDNGTLTDTLPSLSDLSFLSLSFFVYKYRKFEIRFEKKVNDIQQLFMNSYANQLTHLDLDLNNLVGDLRISISKLEQLELRSSSLQFLEHCPSTNLKRLSINGLQSNCGCSIFHVINFIDKFDITLERLSIRFPWKIVLQTDEHGVEPELDYKLDNSTDKKEGNLVSTISPIVFPRLKELTLKFPHCDNAASLIRLALLPKFPGLRKLVFDETWEDSRDNNVSSYIPPEQALRSLIYWEDYWNICPTLLIIVMLPSEILGRDEIRLHRPEIKLG